MPIPVLKKVPHKTVKQEYPSEIETRESKDENRPSIDH